MSGGQLVAMLAVVASLIFVGSGLRGRGVNAPQALRMAAIWAGLFAIVVLFVSIVTGHETGANPLDFT